MFTKDELRIHLSALRVATECDCGNYYMGCNCKDMFKDEFKAIEKIERILKEDNDYPPKPIEDVMEEILADNYHHFEIYYPEKGKPQHNSLKNVSKKMFIILKRYFPGIDVDKKVEDVLSFRSLGTWWDYMEESGLDLD